MSFITNSLIRPLGQWWSEINSATLTGAIDVLVVEQEDGSYLSSPFHVRFGKLGVLKAKEKIVDIEVNDEPVNIHMKLDDNGTAFFVEDISDNEDECIPPELATSPIPNFTDEQYEKIVNDKSKVNRSLLEEFNKYENEQYEDEKSVTSIGGSTVKNKLSRRKRKRRQINNRHSRNNSKTSLKEFIPDDQDNHSSASSTDNQEREKLHLNLKEESDEQKIIKDDNDNDGDLDEDESETAANSHQAVSSTPHNKFQPPPSFQSVQKSDVISPTNTEQSFLQSRLGDEAIENILKTQEKTQLASTIPSTPMSTSRADLQGTDYFSEPEMLNSPTGSRPPTPILSDTEYETKRHNSNDASCAIDKDQQQSWEWGQLPTTVSAKKELNEKTEDLESEKDKKDSEKRNRRWTFSFWNNSNNKQESDKNVPGVYLDELQDDEEMMAIYLGSSKEKYSALNPAPVDDDAESGNGPSLPMSPHSVEGAIGGSRIRYDSSDDDRNFTKKLLPEVSFSLCGGLDSNVENKEEKDSNTVSQFVFEQSLISFDDFLVKLKNNHDIFNDPNLVVRIGEKCYSWKNACPIIMSTVLYGRTLPEEFDKNLKGDDQETITSKENSPNSKRSSWWFFSRKDQGNPDLATASEDKTVDEKSLKEVETKGESVSSSSLPQVKEVSETEQKVEAKVENESEIKEALPSSSAPADLVTIEGELSNKSPENLETKENNEEIPPESEPVIFQENEEEIIEGKRYRKTLRLSSDAVKHLNLKPGSNEAQFSVTTALQGTSKCKCHVYMWKSTDKIVISDIDGTITKSDVLGHVFPIIGKDWAQSGVASLFTKIVSNGYHIAYLSARAIGQASITKDYLSSIRQGDMNLPDGPLFLNPTSLVNAFHREVIEKKPEKFKIACLRDIQKLFPENRNPFYAGYGNRVNDVFAYNTVGIPISRIFTINSKGELRHELTQTFLTSYDCQSSIVDHLFPPILDEKVSPSTNQEFSTFAFWRDPIPAIEDFSLDTDSAKTEEKKE